jgi:hypothetical protein
MMQIDDFVEAQALTDKLQDTLPFKVFPTKFFLGFLLDRGEAVQANAEFVVESLFYSGDAGGIICALEDSPFFSNSQEKMVISISHLKIDPDHPLATEIIDYQRRRIHRLKLQDKGGFAAELLAKMPSTKRKKKLGFGK